MDRSRPPTDSMWEAPEFIEAYHRQTYPDVQKINAKFLEGKPVIKNCDVEYATFHKAATVGSSIAKVQFTRNATRGEFRLAPFKLSPKVLGCLGGSKIY